MKIKSAMFAGLALLLLVHCQSNKTSERVDPNPNGSSELALLMRHMHDSIAKDRTLIEKGEALGSYPESFDEILSAEPTDDHTKDAVFEDMSRDYLQAVKMMYSANTDSSKHYYQIVVSKCENCHHHYCPGPLKKIKRLYF